MTIFDKFVTCRSLLVATMIIIAPPTVSTGHAQEVAVIVDGEPITEFDIEQRSKFRQVGTHNTPSREEVIEELRNEKLKVHEARKFGLLVLDSEVDDTYARYASRMGMTPEQLTQDFAQSGINADTVRHRIRADIAWQKYIRRSAP